MLHKIEKKCEIFKTFLDEENKKVEEVHNEKELQNEEQQDITGEQDKQDITGEHDNPGIDGVQDSIVIEDNNETSVRFAK